MPRVLTAPGPDDPLPERDVPDGFEFVWEKDVGCRVATEEEHETRRCRRPGCGRAPVMAMLRPRYSTRTTNRWWLYCDWHTYGRRVEGDVVLHRVLRPIEGR